MRRRLAHLALVVAAVVSIILMETAGYAATAPDLRRTLTYTVAHATVGIVYAVCAWVAWSVSVPRTPPRVLVAVAFLWIPQPFYAAIESSGYLWPPLVAIDISWAILVGLLVLLYPAGRLSGVDRIIAWTVGACSALRAVTALILDGRGPVTCTCAPNAYLLVSGQPVYDAIDLAFRLIGGALVVFVAVRVTMRWFRSGPPARAVAFVMPISLVAWALTIAYQTVAYVYGSALSAAVDYLSLVATVSVPLCYVAGLLYVRNLRGRVADLMLLTRGGVDRARWEAMLRATLRDPALRVYWWDADVGSFVDGSGLPIVPEPGLHAAHRGSLLRIDSPDSPLAVIDHDSALGENGELLDGISSAVLLSVDNDRLRQELERTLDEVRQSRVRIIEAALDERTRIERDLHDGSQQALVSLALSLRLAADRARTSGAPEIGSEIDRASSQLTEALRGLRELARGIHPTSLTVGGLPVALPELAAASTVPTSLDLESASRYAPIVESTVYFVVAEALTNTAKHARASRATVRVLDLPDALDVSIADDGEGGARFGGGAGSGLAGLRDRVEAVGGAFRVESARGSGTVVRARIPIESPADVEQSRVDDAEPAARPT